MILFENLFIILSDNMFQKPIDLFFADSTSHGRSIESFSEVLLQDVPSKQEK